MIESTAADILYPEDNSPLARKNRRFYSDRKGSMERISKIIALLELNQEPKNWQEQLFVTGYDGQETTSYVRYADGCDPAQVIGSAQIRANGRSLRLRITVKLPGIQFQPEPPLPSLREWARNHVQTEEEEELYTIEGAAKLALKQNQRYAARKLLKAAGQMYYQLNTQG